MIYVPSGKERFAVKRSAPHRFFFTPLSWIEPGSPGGREDRFMFSPHLPAKQKK